MDELEQFKDWWLANRIINTPVDDALNFVADTHGVVLFRHNEFQVELFAVKPNSEIKPHIHPNVDSFEVFVSGDINFMCNDEWFDQNIIGSTIRVKPNSFHGGLFGEKGGCFLSIQRWLNEVKPTFVGNDWADKESKSSYKDSAV
jgi:mannose-6-phosphate isomerase-like protein (cupin superfamily)